MINELDFNIFKAVQQEKKLSEIYVGYSEFEWFFTKGEYSATCTEAIDFTLFDKTICGLLNVEKALSIEQLGEILGFNIIDNPIQNKYKDLAEFEILSEALQSLEEFEMITSGDVQYSYCQLTEIGKEYYQKGKKFKIHENKIFSLFFDNTSNNHIKAKENFEFINSTNINEDNTLINYEDEQFLKNFAEYQIPDIYNLEKMNSFKDTVLVKKEHRQTALYSVFLVDSFSGDYRVLVYENTSKQIKNYFAEYLSSNNEQKIKLFSKVLQKKHLCPSPINSNFDYRNTLINAQEEIEQILSNNSKNLPQKILNTIVGLEYLEPSLFFDNIKQIISNSEDEIWLMFNEISSLLIHAISKIIEQINDKYIFVFLPNEQGFEIELEELVNKIDEKQNCYILLLDQVEEFNIILKQNDKSIIYKKTISPLKISNKVYEQEFFRKYSDINLSNHISNFKSMFAEEYIDLLVDSIDEKFNILSEDLLNTKIEDVEIIDYKLKPFYKITEYDEFFSPLIKKKDGLLVEIRAKRKENIINKIELIEQELSKVDFSKDTILLSLKSKIESEKKKCYSFEIDLFLGIEKKVTYLEKEYALIKKRKSIIIDTNILIEEPKIIDLIGNNQKIVFSGKVIDELDSLKGRNNTKDKAQQALREIRKHQKDKNISFNTSNVKNLPEDFNKNSPDNMILSVAIQYKKYNPILLTNDKGLQIKAEMLDIPAKTIEELKSLLSLSNANQSKRKNNKPKKR